MVGGGKLREIPLNFIAKIIGKLFRIFSLKPFSFLKNRDKFLSRNLRELNDRIYFKA